MKEEKESLTYDSRVYVNDTDADFSRVKDCKIGGISRIFVGNIFCGHNNNKRKSERSLKI